MKLFTRRDKKFIYRSQLTQDEQAIFKYMRSVIKFDLSYTLGGANYFSGGINKRGYKLFITPVTLKNGCEEHTLLSADLMESGFYILVEEVARYNQSRLIQLAEKLDDHLEEYKTLYITRQWATLNALVLTHAGTKKEEVCTTAST